MQQVPWMICAALARRSLLGRSWDQVAAAAGRALLTDDIHLSEAATLPLVELVAGWLTGLHST
jgi:Mg/Co/Ni transporter MgtE